MKTRLRNTWESIRSSFFLIPGLIVIAALGMAMAAVYVDERIDAGSYGLLCLLYSGGAAGARSILSTIAGSMISVAGVTFSITIVALTLTTSQFGPRLLRNFLRHPGNQIVLGVFVGTFIYCVLVLGSMSSREGHAFVPILSINLAILLAIIGVGILVYFIHHVSKSIQADNVVQAVHDELLERLLPLFPEEGKAVDPAKTKESEISGTHKDRYHDIRRIRAIESGYLQAIDADGLVDCAQRSDTLIHLQYRPGEYVTEGTALALVNFNDNLDADIVKTIVDSFILGRHRTPEQDAEFAIHQLVEIAVRALSPGINDPHTAISCIDRLGAALCFLADRTFPSAKRYDHDGHLRLVTKPWTFPGVVNAAFDQIRQCARSQVAVMIQLLETFRTIAQLSRTDEQRRAILRQGEMIMRSASVSTLDENDKQDIEERFRALRDALLESETASVDR